MNVNKSIDNLKNTCNGCLSLSGQNVTFYRKLNIWIEYRCDNLHINIFRKCMSTGESITTIGKI
jgi:hypothetical protein